MTRRSLSTFTPCDWTPDGREPESRDALHAAYARWRKARHEGWREHAPPGAQRPSAWEEARALAEAMAALRRTEADRV